MRLFFIRSFEDNYIWILENKKTCVIVDPGQSEKVCHFLHKRKFLPIAILITHHHDDHVSGVSQIKEEYPNIEVFAPEEVRSKEITYIIKKERNRIDLPYFSFNTFHVPGHTSGHLLYYEKPYLFCGDTLFSGGCGKIFEGTTQQMFRSILLIKSFPQNTLICCAHEYTVKNLKFAKLLLPNDNHIKRYLDHSQKRVSKFLPTVPSTLEVEKKINIFLRCGDENIRRSLKKVGIEWRGIDSLKTGEHETFSILRKMRDRF